MNLLITVYVHDGRYHGTDDWPPSPARLFQALVAGSCFGESLQDEDKKIFKWLENLQAPVIGAPHKNDGQSVIFYVPRNTIDSQGCNLERIADIRQEKNVEPRLFDSQIPFLYLWSFNHGEEGMMQGSAICNITNNLYQLGRGVDMAWAQGELLEAKEVDERLLAYPGQIYRSTKGRNGGIELSCPCPGSLDSLVTRYKASLSRFHHESNSQILTQPPRPRFTEITYNSPPIRCLFELRKATDDTQFAPCQLIQSTKLVMEIRDSAIQKLRKTLPQQEGIVNRAFIGQTQDNIHVENDRTQVCIIPLPSIGHRNVDCEIRRILIEVPPNCQLYAEDIFWAFSGINLTGSDLNGGVETILTRIQDKKKQKMLTHYGVIDGSIFKVWHTITPAALPEGARRRRIDPSRTHEEAKSGSERASEEMRAAVAIFHELRTLRMLPHIESIHVQREPFEGNGMRAEAFSVGTMFAKERLWHVEVIFKEPVNGPLVIGNGRFLGLGVMAPVRDT